MEFAKGFEEAVMTNQVAFHFAKAWISYAVILASAVA
jgi:hypothetical protein